MSEQVIHKEPYMKIFWALLVLTLAEVGIFYLHLGKVYLVTALVLMALMKAFLVAWYFMHLRFERWTLMILALIPLALAFDLYLGLLPDVGQIPF
jgi:cytochrome c oxidase subunit IV